MPRYKVLALSYIDHRLVQEGEEVEYDHEPGHNLEPIDAAAKKRKQAWLESGASKRKAPGDAGYISQLMSDNGDPAVGVIPGPGSSAKATHLYASDTAAPTQ